MAGAPLQVIGVLNSRTSVEHVERIVENPRQLSVFFFKHILTPAVKAMPDSKRTRKNNLGLDFVPVYYRIYTEDLSLLSQNIRRILKLLPRDTPYYFQFLYCKYGQQLEICHVLIFPFA